MGGNPFAKARRLSTRKVGQLIKGLLWDNEHMRFYLQDCITCKVVVVIDIIHNIVELQWLEH